MKVYLSLSPDEIDATSGIGQIVLAQHRYLPGLGIEIVKDPRAADVIACHITQGTLPRVDVLHCHGLYFSDVAHVPYRNWNYTANRDIVSAAAQAYRTTVPSEWVAEPFKRDMRISPDVIGHGVTLSDWSGAKKHGGYVLYNKNRESDVCMSLPAWVLAEKGIRVVSTFKPLDKPELPNLTLTGVLPHPQMKKLISEAEVYLATTLETFGIGTLEALACGVPVLGYDWGGTADLVEHKVNGYLVRPGDLAGLVEGYNYIRKNRRELSENAVALSRKYDWANIMQNYAELYRAAYAERMAEQKAGSDTTIVITNYNYGRWVGEAINSVLAQTVQPEEIIVVDDGSTDNSLEVLKRFSGKIRIIAKKNGGVASARDAGIAAAKTRFVTCLDADDKIDPRFVELLSGALKKKRDLGIAYSGLALMDENSTIRQYPTWPPEFAWEIQASPGNPPPNCIPSGCMFRKAMWERAGGYRQAYAPGEDAEFWLRGLSVGFDAVRVTQEPLFHYRMHSGGASKTRKYHAIYDKMPWVVDKEFPMGAPTRKPTTVRSYIEPFVSIIIPVGARHKRLVRDAIDSIVGQSYRSWEIIVVWDCLAAALPKAYPFVRQLHTPKPASGAGVARNLGIDAARGKTVLFLDADDILMPNALERMAQAFENNGGHYIYTDYLAVLEDGTLREHDAAEYSQTEWKMQHSISVMMDREQAAKLRFDESMPSWEDWDFFIRAAISGYCGQRLPEKLLLYNLTTGTRRLSVLAANGEPNSEGSAILAQMKKKYETYYAGEKSMSPCCGGKAAIPIMKAKNTIGTYVPPVEGATMSDQTFVRMEYVGTNAGAIGFKVNGRTYRGGADPMHRFLNAAPEDVDGLIATGRFRRVNMPVQAVSTPQAISGKIDDAPKPVPQQLTQAEVQEMAARSLMEARKGLRDIDEELAEAAAVSAEETKELNDFEEDEEEAAAPVETDDFEAMYTPKRGRRKK